MLVMRFLAFTVAALVGLTGCLPPYLAKYRQQNGATAEPGEPLAATPGNQAATPASVGEDSPPAPTSRKAEPRLTQVDPQTFRIPAPIGEVWDSAVDVLVKNYTLTAVEPKTGVISTEWDTYYKDDMTYRNRLTLRFKGIAPQETELVVANTLQSLGYPTEGVAEVWLPVEGSEEEIVRVAKNVAILLGINEDLPPPRPVAIKPKSSDKPAEPSDAEIPVPPKVPQPH